MINEKIYLDGKITLLDCIDYSYGLNLSRAALFYKKSADAGSFKIRYGKSNDGFVNSFVLAGGVPLFKWRSSKSETFYHAGFGINNIENGSSDEKKTQTDEIKERDIETAFTNSLNLLEKLDAGFYLLTFADHYPVGLDAKFFGELSNNPLRYKFNYTASAARAFPAYLAPASPASSYDINKINHYRKAMRNGEFIFSSAIYFDDFISVILRGHHKAAAAYLEGRIIPCLTVIPCSGYAHDNKSVTSLFFASNQIDASGITSDFLFEMMQNKNKKIITEAETIGYLSKTSDEWNKRHELFIDESTDGKFLKIKTIEGISIIKDISDDRINSLLSSPSPDYKSLEMLFDVLTGLNDGRAYALALKLAGSESYLGLWPQAFSHLAAFKNKEVEKLFVDYLINDEYGLSDITKIIDAYFEHDRI